MLELTGKEMRGCPEDCREQSETFALCEKRVISKEIGYTWSSLEKVGLIKVAPKIF
jgi:hypothetical protein